MNSMEHDGCETEWQFDALDLRPVVRWLETPAGWIDEVPPLRVVPAGSAGHVDRYLDTEDQRLHRAGYALRLRRVGRRAGAEATLESLESATNGPGARRRREISEPLDQGHPSSVIDADGPVGTRVRCLVGPRSLRPLFEVRTRRRLYELESDALSAGEISLDETAIHLAGGGAPARIRRVGIRLPGAAADGRRFVGWLSGACALQPAALSEYEVGRLSAALEAPPPFQFGPTDVDADASIRAVALSVLRRHFSVMLAKEPGTRLADDIEELHDMRVATRRLRAVLSLFEDVLPVTVTKLGSELAWLGRTLGAVRDLDVQLVELDRLIDGGFEIGSGGARRPPRAARDPARGRAHGDAGGARLAPVRDVRGAVRPHAERPPRKSLGNRSAARTRHCPRPDRDQLPWLPQGRRPDPSGIAGHRLPPGADPRQARPLHPRVPRRPVSRKDGAPRRGAHLPPGHPRAPPGR